jgi:asparagine synthase (glutamine-hydrolysing)
VCGIAGVLNGPELPPVELERLRAMAAVLRHRGPDGYGFYRDPRVGLASVRLSIVDLTGGDQPLTNEDETVWLSFNGEIFNYVELRRELAARGHRFRSQGDSEVIVHAYEEYGEAAWAKLNGQFAIALWDRPRRQLWLVRDQLGIHPLHYTVTADRLVFASEAKALFASGWVEVAIDPSGIRDVFTRWSTTSPSTVFAGVRSVRPGTALRIDTDLRCHEQRWWQPDLSADPELAGLSQDEAAEQLGERLSEAVRLRLRADVPVGAYLSGGLDSSVVASLVQQGDSPLETFAVRFADPVFDETPQQRQMAGLLGTRHHEILCGPAEIADSLREVVWHCETPLLRTAPVPLYLLSGLVREAGMKVVLTGEGADELLAGYAVFKEDAVRRFWARRPESPLGPALAARLHPEVQAAGARGTGVWARFFGRDLGATHDPFYAHRIRWRNTAWSQRVLAAEVRQAASTASQDDDTEEVLRRELPAGFAGWEPLARAQWTEITSFMSSYLLSCQGDRVALGHGVEVRYPFLDPNVVDWAFRLPTRLKLAGLRDKVVLRRLASRSLPAEIWQRPKQPYRAPTTTALFGPGSPDHVRDLVGDEAVARLGLLDPRAVRRLVDRAEARRGAMTGEREEMALVGAVTLQALGQLYLVDLARRVDEALVRLDATEPTVLVDLVAPADQPEVVAP